MAESGSATQQTNGSEARKTALRAAAIAAASGATAIAARRAFSQQGDSGESGGSNGGGSGMGASALGGAMSSGWNAARDALVPFAADAAKAGGEYLAKNGPDFVRDTIVPAFIEGFQNAS
jgi:hypothetical protein